MDDQSEKKEDAEKMSEDMVLIMIEKIFEMKELKKQILKEKKKKLNKLKRQFEKKINGIDKDIYKFANATKLLSSAKKYYSLTAMFNAKKMNESKVLNSSSTNNNKENNNELKEETKNGQA